MRNIGEIFIADLKNATKSAVGVVVLVGLVVVPAMYAWFNILGGWDPYENTDGLKIAVANADEGYSSDLVPVDLNIGDSVVAALRANDRFAWEFVSEDEAVESVRSGSCYAAIVIPESFSADMMTLFSTDIKHSDIVSAQSEGERHRSARDRQRRKRRAGEHRRNVREHGGRSGPQGDLAAHHVHGRRRHELVRRDVESKPGVPRSRPR